jgi:hypothetical protein
MADTTSTDAAAEPAHVETVLVALAMLAPPFMIAIVVGPREPVVLLAIALYLGLLVGGAVVTGLLDAL